MSKLCWGTSTRVSTVVRETKGIIWWTKDKEGLSYSSLHWWSPDLSQDMRLPCRGCTGSLRPNPMRLAQAGLCDGDAGRPVTEFIHSKDDVSLYLVQVCSASPANLSLRTCASLWTDRFERSGSNTSASFQSLFMIRFVLVLIGPIGAPASVLRSCTYSC